MIPELGHLALILALCVAVVQSLVPLIGAQRRLAGWVALATPAALLQLLFTAIAFFALTWAFLQHDFSVSYVAQNSNTKLPTLYLVSGVWGAHEGSLLLWVFLLSLWGALVALLGRSVPAVVKARVVAVLGSIGVGFLLFMLLTSNPFERLPNAPAEGRDLNPLLQDPGLAFHPPMLYLGYVGLAVPFAFAIAALLGGRLDAAWARWVRPWTDVAWLFLTLGITLGSWWAYYELGWGGWWFWDPVENASFMPWLVATALIHSLAVTDKRGAFKAWTVLLAITAFSLSLLGTFLVRSGVLTSVHAFATDPERGIFILIFLAVVVGVSLALYAARAPQLRASAGFQLLSKESGLLLNNVILLVATASILLGTLYPLLLDALGLGKISVGAPYFNAVFVPLTLPLTLLVGLGVVARWKRQSWPPLRSAIVPPLFAALLAGALLPFVFDGYAPMAAVGMAAALFVTFITANELWRRYAAGSRPALAVWGMHLGHMGMAVFVVGVTLTSLYSSEKDVRLSPGESYELGGYSFRFDGVTPQSGPNYVASRGTVTIHREGKLVAELAPEKRAYTTSAMPMTEAGIDAGLWRDLFVALGEPLGEEGAWSLRLYHKPFVRWIWFGGLIMALGALLAAADRRYRRLRGDA